MKTFTSRLAQAVKKGEDRLLHQPTYRGFTRTFTSRDEYAPRVIAQDLLEALMQPSATPPTANGEDADAWLDLLSRFDIDLKRAEIVKSTHSLKTKDFLKDLLWSAMQTWESLPWTMLGKLLRFHKATKVGHIRAWDAAGFYEAYALLEKAHPNSTPTSHAVTVNTARFAAYAVNTLENFSAPPELEELRACTKALKNGIIPMAIENDVLYLINRHTL